MDDIAEKLAIRDSFLRKMAARKSPDELMREMFQRRQAMWDRMMRIPGMFDEFKRKHFRQRAIHVRPEHLQ